MSDEIPTHVDKESRDLESVPLKTQPVPSAETEAPTEDSNQLRPTTKVEARSPNASIIGLSVAVAILAAFLGYELVQAKENARLLDEANGKAATVETNRKNLESELEIVVSQMDMKIEEARASSQRLTENLTKEEEKNRILQAHAVKAAAAVQAKASLAGELNSLESADRELAKRMLRAEAEVRRLSGKVASPKTSSSVSKSKQKTPSKVERTVLQIASGPNKGRWHFAAADGFRSPLYGSRKGALRDAELRARTGN